MEKLLSTLELEKIYGEGRNQVHALKNINISFCSGECVAVIGRSGSGKSTLLHMLGGMDYPTSGKVIYDGKDIYSMGDKELSEYRSRHVGYVFQDFKLIPELSVCENIVLPQIIEKKKPDYQVVEELMEELGLNVKQNVYPEELSGGQQQRVAIARALIQKQEILLCDEPTGNLDEKTGKEVMELLRKTREQYQTTVIIVTHDLKVAGACDRVIELVDGVVQ